MALLVMRMKLHFFVLTLIPLFITGQDGIPYLDFSLRNSGRAVEVEWQVLPGNFCQDVEIWRGTDSTVLEEVYVYPGICGDDDSLKTYYYIDLPPRSGITYFYRLVVITDRTEIKSLLVYPDKELEMFPNPADDRVWIIRDPAEKPDRYSLYSLDGKAIFTIEMPEVREEIMLDGLPAGKYILSLESQSGRVNERLIIR